MTTYIRFNFNFISGDFISGFYCNHGINYNFVFILILMKKLSNIFADFRRGRPGIRAQEEGDQGGGRRRQETEGQQQEGHRRRGQDRQGDVRERPRWRWRSECAKWQFRDDLSKDRSSRGAIASWWRGQIFTSPPGGEASCDCIVARWNSATEGRISPPGANFAMIESKTAANFTSRWWNLVIRERISPRGGEILFFLQEWKSLPTVFQPVVGWEFDLTPMQ